MAKILIVDDSSTETYKLTNILERNDHLVLSAESGEQGINLAKSEQPDVVLTPKRRRFVPKDLPPAGTPSDAAHLARILERIEGGDTAPLSGPSPTQTTMEIKERNRRLRVTSDLAASPATVFEFCRTATCFKAIFPERISMMGQDDAYVVADAEFQFRQWMFNAIPVRWRVGIEDWEETETSRAFTDVQRAGPLGLFRHRHICAARADGLCTYTDDVTFSSGFGPLADRFIAAPYMTRVFEHRHRVMRALLRDAEVLNAA